MEHHCTTISCTEVDKLRFRYGEDIRVYQLENGSLFYHKDSSRQQLYVDENGIKLSAKLPEEYISGLGAIRNELYFFAESKIYKASFDPSKGITVDLVRVINHAKSYHYETAYSGALLSQEIDGETRVYRMSEDFNQGIVVSISREQLHGARLAGIHRNKIVYVVSTNDDVVPVAREIGKNVLVIKCHRPSDSTFGYHVSEDSSPFIYVASGNRLFSLNTDTMDFMPTLLFKNVTISSIAGVHNGLITMVGQNDSEEWRVLTAELPDGYKLAEDSTVAAFQCDCF